MLQGRLLGEEQVRHLVVLEQLVKGGLHHLGLHGGRADEDPAEHHRHRGQHDGRERRHLIRRDPAEAENEDDGLETSSGKARGIRG